MSKIEKQYLDHHYNSYIADVLVRIINTYIHIPVVLFNQQLALNLCDMLLSPLVRATMFIARHNCMRT